MASIYLYRLFSRQTFLLHKAGKAQVEFLTSMAAAFHSGEPVPGLWFCACLLTDMAYTGSLR